MGTDFRGVQGTVPLRRQSWPAGQSARESLRGRGEGGVGGATFDSERPRRVGQQGRQKTRGMEASRQVWSWSSKHWGVELVIEIRNA